MHILVDELLKYLKIEVGFYFEILVLFSPKMEYNIFESIPDLVPLTVSLAFIDAECGWGLDVDEPALVAVDVLPAALLRGPGGQLQVLPGLNLATITLSWSQH